MNSSNTESIRPEGYNETRDCTVRSLVYALGVSYELAHSKCREHGRKNRRTFRLHDHCAAIVKELGFCAKHIKRSGSVAKLRREYPQGNLIVRVSGHAFAILNGEYQPGQESQDDRRVKNAWVIEPK